MFDNNYKDYFTNYKGIFIILSKYFDNYNDIFYIALR